FVSEILGDDKNYLITAQVPRDWSAAGLNRVETIRQELVSLPQVENVSISYDVPSAPGSGIIQVAKLGQEQGTPMQRIVSDAHYADTYQIPMLAGDFFAKEKGAAHDAQKAVINERAAKALGYDRPEAAIGQQLSMNDGR